MVLQNRFQARVKDELKLRGWNQTRLGTEMGVGPQYVSDYLSGRRSPGLDVIERFAAALGMDPVDLLMEPATVS